MYINIIIRLFYNYNCEIMTLHSISFSPFNIHNMCPQLLFTLSNIRQFYFSRESQWPPRGGGANGAIRPRLPVKVAPKIGIKNLPRAPKFLWEALVISMGYFYDTCRYIYFLISRWGTVPTATIGFGIFRGSAIADRKSPLYTNFHYDTSRF